MPLSKDSTQRVFDALGVIHRQSYAGGLYDDLWKNQVMNHITHREVFFDSNPIETRKMIRTVWGFATAAAFITLVLSFCLWFGESAATTDALNNLLQNPTTADLEDFFFFL